MRDKVSELMDGELDETDAAGVIGAIQSNNDLFSDWKAYHVIGDSLRRSTVPMIDVSQHIRSRLVNEPTLLVPYLHKPYGYQKQKLLGFSVAASIAVLSIGWLISQPVEQQHTTLQEVYVAEKTDKEMSTSDNHRPILTFQPESAYMLPSVPVNNGYNSYPWVHRGFIHSGTVHHPHPGMQQIAESSQEQSALPAE